MSFCHLHTHSHFSPLDGVSTVEEIHDIAKGHGQEALCITDHGSLASSLKHFKAGKESGLQSIFGVETYITPDITVKDKESPTWHMILLAMNRQGLQDLFAMSKIGWIEGFYKKPRIDYKILEKYGKNLIATTSCQGGELARALTDDDWKEAGEVLTRYKSIFGNRLYVELQPGNPVDLNKKLFGIAEDLGVCQTVAVDAHHSTSDQEVAQELMLLMQTIPSMKRGDKDYAKLNYEAARREPTLIKRINALWPNRTLRFDKLELHIMSRQEVVTAMDNQGFDGNLLADTTLEIAERIEKVEFKIGQNYLPKIAKSVNSYDYLSALAFDGLEERGKHKDQEYIDRLEFELAEIKAKGFENYFLIVWDIIREARDRNIYISPGRGSAAGCLLAYCLRITSVDPIKYKLLFFRFIDPERPDWPDIDMDFEHRRRDEMKDYVRDKYGDASSLGTFTTLKSKSLIRGIARVLSIPLPEVDTVCKKFNELEEYQESDATKEFRAAHPEIYPLAKKLEGRISSTGMHAAAVVVADRPLSDIVPIETRTDPEDKTKRVEVCSYDMHDASDVGLIKFDFLGLTTLSIIHDTIDLIKERHGIDIDWERLEPDDADVLASLNTANTVGVFQMESSAYRKLLLAMGVDSFNDLVASNALVRPGAFNTVAKDYIRRKKGLDKVTYPHFDVEKELEETYGVYIYQEQIMQLAVKLGGFTWGKANALRKIIGKKLSKEEFAPYFEPWLEGAGEKIGKKEAEQMWRHFEAHSNYSFNKSHAVCYSYNGYVTAWLKYYYPLEFLYGLLKNEKKDTSKMTYLLEARRMGISILPPDINKSEANMSIDGDALRFGLGDIKSVGFAAIEEILNKRPFVSWEDFDERVVARKLNSRVRGSLVAVDAFASLPNAPRHPNPIENYQEYLSYPVALESIAKLGLELSSIEEFNESENFSLVAGVVKAIKRTDKYVRVEIEDLTSNVTVFAAMDSDLSSGDVIIALIGDNTLVGYSKVDTLEQRKENDNLTNFEKWLFEDQFPKYQLLRDFGIDSIYDPKSLVLPIQVREITTKAGKRMAYLYFADADKNIAKAIVFPAIWTQLAKKVTEWNMACVKFSLTDSGDLTIWGDGIVEASVVLQDKINKLKGIK